MTLHCLRRRTIGLGRALATEIPHLLHGLFAPSPPCHLQQVYASNNPPYPTINFLAHVKETGAAPHLDTFSAWISHDRILANSFYSLMQHSRALHGKKRGRGKRKRIRIQTYHPVRGTEAALPLPP